MGPPASARVQVTICMVLGSEAWQALPVLEARVASQVLTTRPRRVLVTSPLDKASILTCAGPACKSTLFLFVILRGTGY